MTAPARQVSSPTRGVAIDEGARAVLEVAQLVSIDR
jgi:hypothetical protein